MRGKKRWGILPVLSLLLLAILFFLLRQLYLPSWAEEEERGTGGKNGRVVSAPQPETEVAVPCRLRLCVDSRNWYPFTFRVGKQAGGIHVDLIRMALDNLGYEVEIRAYPRNRCLLYLQQGKVDGMISVAYDRVIDGFADYPADACRDGESAWRIMQVDHVVITSVGDDYDYRGDIKTLPQPVRIPRGEIFKDMLGDAGLKVEEGKEDFNNFLKLIRDGKGVVITTSVMAEQLMEDPLVGGKFIIQPIPVSSLSYFLAFARYTPLPAGRQLEIWDEIARLRDDYVYMLQLFAHY